MTELRGITWNHTRGYVPLEATAQRFSELHPDVHVRWEKRSLQQFADASIEKLASRYDLLVIDHPSTGSAAASQALLPLDEHLPADFLSDQEKNSVGASHRSYFYGGHQWALAIDAATPVSGWRPDLLDRAGATVPETWPELLELARRGLVILPAIPIDSLMNFYMLCGGLGDDPFPSAGEVASREVGTAALAMLRELVTLCPAECLAWNPIAVWETLSSTDRAALCPFAYGYSNYARAGYGQHVLRFGGLIRANRACRSTLGGAGLAVSSRRSQVTEAIDYCRFVAHPLSQSGIYFDSGGQPGHRAAWLDERVNQACGSFFLDTLPTLDAAYVRPRWNHYLSFQEGAAAVVHGYLKSGGDAGAALDEINNLLAASQEHQDSEERR